MNSENQSNLDLLLLSNKRKKENTLAEKTCLKNLQKIGQSIGLKFESNTENGLLSRDKDTNKSLNKLISVIQLISPKPKFDSSYSQAVFLPKNSPLPKAKINEFSPISVHRLIFPKPSSLKQQKPQIITNPKFILKEISYFTIPSKDPELKNLSISNSAKPLLIISPKLTKKTQEPAVISNKNKQANQSIQKPKLPPLNPLEKSFKSKFYRKVLPAVCPNKETPLKTPNSHSIDLTAWD